MSQNQSDNTSPSRKNYSVHVEIGVTYSKHGKPSRKFFHVGSFKTFELAQQYAQWLSQCLHKFTSELMTSDNNQHIWIVRPIITTQSESYRQVSAVKNFKVHYYNYFLYTITAILDAFDININPKHREILLQMEFDNYMG